MSAEGRYAAALAELLALRLPLMAHQRAIIDTLAAEGPDGRLPTPAALLAPRQVGKTTALFLLALTRMWRRRGYAAAYSAQSGMVVTKRMAAPATGWFDLIGASPLAARHRDRRSTGTERLWNTSTRSSLMAFAPRAGNLRSESLDLVILDECQEHSRELGAALDADIAPVFDTRPGAQLIRAGTASGPSWWLDAVTAARAAGTLIELGTWPADADPTDPAVWRAHHPGLRAGLTTETALAKALDLLGPDVFAREYGNRWSVAPIAAPSVADTLWVPALTTDRPPAPSVLAVDVALDNAAAAIVAAGPGLTAGTLTAGVAGYRPGIGWLRPELARLRATYRVPIWADPESPAGPALAGLPGIRWVTTAQYARAGPTMAGRLDARTLRIIDHPALAAARLVAVRRDTDRGGWFWSRGRSPGDICPMVALTLAVWAAGKTPARPRIVTTDTAQPSSPS